MPCEHHFLIQGSILRFSFAILQGFKAMVENCYNSNLEKKRVLLVAPLFDLGVDFGVFDAKIWVLRARVLILRSPREVGVMESHGM
jgi:hypothetical protein